MNTPHAPARTLSRRLPASRAALALLAAIATLPAVHAQSLTYTGGVFAPPYDLENPEAPLPPSDHWTLDASLVIGWRNDGYGSVASSSLTIADGGTISVTTNPANLNLVLVGWGHILATQG